MPDNKVVLVTGASSGIGHDIAVSLSRAGHTVFGTSRNPTNHDRPTSFTLLPLDVRSDQSVRTCVEQVMAQAGGIDVLVNNAGYVVLAAVEEASLEQAEDIFDANVFGVIRMCQAVLPVMRAQKRGQIVNISSIAGLNPVPFWGLYNASKFALEGVTESLRHELTPLNIAAVLVEPSFFKSNLGGNTQLGSRSIADYEPTRQRASARIRHFHDSRPAPRIVAEAVVKIVQSEAPQARYMLGPDVRYYQLRKWMPSALWERAVRRYWHLDGKSS